MKAEDYDAFIEDPADWAIRKYWPRVFTELEGLALLPPLGIAAFGTYSLSNPRLLKAPPVAKALDALARAVEAQARPTRERCETVRAHGGPRLRAAHLRRLRTEAPFDFMSDTLRGMRGIMLDLYRRPKSSSRPEEKVSVFSSSMRSAGAEPRASTSPSSPLHRGSDGFMSLAQFEKFYWPQLKALMLGLIDAGIMPYVFYEGAWDQRLKYLAELPKGKTVGWFQSSDIFKVKEVVGDTMCIAGGMRNSLLQAGTPEEVRDFTIRLCQEVGKGGGFIMTTGVGEMEGCKPELVKVWVDTTKEYGQYA